VNVYNFGGNLSESTWPTKLVLQTLCFKVTLHAIVNIIIYVFLELPLTLQKKFLLSWNNFIRVGYHK